MKTLLRTLLFLALIVWLGAEIFFPIVAATTFETLRPNTHLAGTIAGGLLRILHGMGLGAGFVALVVLRVREPNLERPFKAGNFAVACLLGAGPAALIGYALYTARDEKIFGTTSALLFSVAVGLLGPVIYWATAVPMARRRLAAAPADGD